MHDLYRFRLQNPKDLRNIGLDFGKIGTQPNEPLTYLDTVCGLASSAAEDDVACKLRHCPHALRLASEHNAFILRFGEAEIDDPGSRRFIRHRN